MEKHTDSDAVSMLSIVQGSALGWDDTGIPGAQNTAGWILWNSAQDIPEFLVLLPTPGIATRAGSRMGRRSALERESTA